MNKDQRKELQKAIELMEQAREQIETIQGEEWDKFNNLPEGLQGSENGEKLERYAEELEEIESEIRDLTERVQAVIDGEI